MSREEDEGEKEEEEHEQSESVNESIIEQIEPNNNKRINLSCYRHGNKPCCVISRPDLPTDKQSSITINNRHFSLPPSVSLDLFMHCHPASVLNTRSYMQTLYVHLTNCIPMKLKILF